MKVAALSTTVRALSAAEIEPRLPELIALLKDGVDGGASLGFLPPLAPEEARRYWLSLRADLESGSRVLIAVLVDGKLAGTGQLSLPPWSNGRHRGDLQKVMVDSRLRGKGLGKLIMTGLHDAARERGRTLLVLNTRFAEGPEQFYKDLGYREVGVIPGYTSGPNGERYDNMTLYLNLGS